jgi:hypothetical protein
MFIIPKRRDAAGGFRIMFFFHTSNKIKTTLHLKRNELFLGDFKSFPNFQQFPTISPFKDSQNLKFLISDFFITPSLRFDANMKKYKNK